jgi:hypothetical protein
MTFLLWLIIVSVPAVGKVPNLWALTNLTTLDLSNNDLDGPVGPVDRSLVNHPALQFLNMSFNKLTGSMPAGRSNLAIIDLSNNLLTVETVDLRNVHALNLSNNWCKKTLQNITLSNQGSIVDFRGNLFRCSYPKGALDKYVVMWDDCILQDFFAPLLVILAVSVITVYVYKEYRDRTQHRASMIADTSEQGPAKTGGFVTIVLTFGQMALMVLIWVDMILDIISNQQMQNYIGSQKQTDCGILNQKGTFDASGFSYLGELYPSTNSYTNFSQFMQQLFIRFPIEEIEVQDQIRSFKTTCLSTNVLERAPECEFTPYACVKVGVYERPGQVFGSACAH